MNKNFWSIKKSLVNKEKSDILLQENTLIPISEKLFYVHRKTTCQLNRAFT